MKKVEYFDNITIIKIKDFVYENLIVLVKL